jgi:hypothetical protein
MSLVLSADLQLIRHPYRVGKLESSSELAAYTQPFPIPNSNSFIPLILTGTGHLICTILQMFRVVKFHLCIEASWPPKHLKRTFGIAAQNPCLDARSMQILPVYLPNS